MMIRSPRLSAIALISLLCCNLPSVVGQNALSSSLNSGPAKQDAEEIAAPKLPRLYRTSVRSFQVRHADPNSVARLLGEQFPDFSFSFDDSSNRVYCRIEKEASKEIEELIAEIDQHTEQRELARQKESQGESDESDIRVNRSSTPQNQLGSPVVFPLKHVSAQDASQIFDSLGLIGSDLRITVAPSDNAILIRGTQEEASRATEILQMLDTESKKKPVGFVSTKPAKTPESFRREHEQAEQRAIELAAHIRDQRKKNAGKQTAELKGLSEDLRQMVRMSFQRRMELQRKQLDSAQANLMAARERLDQRQRLVDRIVEVRVKELLEAKPQPQSAAKSKSAFELTRRSVTDPLGRGRENGPRSIELDESAKVFRKHFGVALQWNEKDQKWVIRDMDRDNAIHMTRPGTPPQLSDSLRGIQAMICAPPQREPQAKAFEFNTRDSLGAFLDRLPVCLDGTLRMSLHGNRMLFHLRKPSDLKVDDAVRADINRMRVNLADEISDVKTKIAELSASDTLDVAKSNAVVSTLPNEVVKLELQLSEVSDQKSSLEEIRDSDTAQQLKELSVDDTADRSSLLRLSRLLSDQVRGVMGNELSNSNSNVDSAIVTVEEKKKLLQRRLRSLNESIEKAKKSQQAHRELNNSIQVLNQRVKELQKLLERYDEFK